MATIYSKMEHDEENKKVYIFHVYRPGFQAYKGVYCNNKHSRSRVIYASSPMTAALASAYRGAMPVQIWNYPGEKNVSVEILLKRSMCTTIYVGDQGP